MNARQPAPVAIRRKNAAADLPARDEVVQEDGAPAPAAPAPAPVPQPAPAPASVAPTQAEATLIHNVRIPASLKKRLQRGVNQLRLDEDDMSISETSLTIAALTAYLDSKGM